MRSERLRSLVALGIGVLAANAAPPVPAVADEPAPFFIPGVLPLSGSFSALGSTIQSTLKLVERKVNADGGIEGRPLRFDIRDDESSPQVAVQVTEQLLAEKPSAIIGSTVVAMCAAMEPLTHNGPVQYCLSPAIHPSAGSFMFSAGYSTHEQFEALVRYLRLRKLHRIASIATIDATGIDGDHQLSQVLGDRANATLRLIDSEHFNWNDANVSAQIARIKARHPDALVVSTTGAALGTVFRGLIDAGLDITVTSESSNLSVPLLTRLEPYLPKDLVFPGMQFLIGPEKPSGPSSKQIAAYLTAIHAGALDNDQFAGLAWDPALLLVDAYRRFGTHATPEQLRRFIDSQRHWAGINGVYDFGRKDAVQRGLSVDDVRMVRWVPTTQRWIAIGTN